MKNDYYVDAIMGEWKHDKRKSNKEHLCYARKAEVKLHRDNFVKYIDPEDLKEYRVYGEVVLTEKKLIDLKTSLITYFRGVELTKTSNKDLII